MVLAEDLDSVRHLVGAYLVSLIQVHILYIFTNMKQPILVMDLRPETPNGLVSCHQCLKDGEQNKFDHFNCL